MLPAGSAWRAIRFVPTQRVSYINLFPRSFASSEKVEMDEQEIKERNVYSIIGEDGFEKLSRAFYRRVQKDPLLSNMYADGLNLRGEAEHISTLEPARIRACHSVSSRHFENYIRGLSLQEYLVGRFGGPQRYIEQHGHPRLRMRHRHFAIDKGGRDRWMDLMKESLDEMKFPPEASQPMLGFFEHMSTHMINAQ